MVTLASGDDVWTEIVEARADPGPVRRDRRPVARRRGVAAGGPRPRSVGAPDGSPRVAAPRVRSARPRADGPLARPVLGPVAARRARAGPLRRPRPGRRDRVRGEELGRRVRRPLVVGPGGVRRGRRRRVRRRPRARGRADGDRGVDAARADHPRTPARAHAHSRRRRRVARPGALAALARGVERRGARPAPAAGPDPGRAAARDALAPPPARPRWSCACGAAGGSGSRANRTLAALEDGATPRGS